jgi:hypothetical protein
MMGRLAVIDARMVRLGAEAGDYEKRRLNLTRPLMLLAHEELSAYPGSKRREQGGDECNIEDFRRETDGAHGARQPIAEIDKRRCPNRAERTFAT